MEIIVSSIFLKTAPVMMLRYLPVACMLIFSSCLQRDNTTSHIRLQLKHTTSRMYAPIRFDAPRLPAAYYPGGPDSLRAFFIRHFRYPAAAFRDSASGNITVRFMMDEDGQFYNMRISSKPHGSGLEEEVLRVSSQMPAWKAPVAYGKPFACEVSMVVSVPLPIKRSAMQTGLPSDYFQVTWSAAPLTLSVVFTNTVTTYCPDVWKLDPPPNDSLVVTEPPASVEVPERPFDDIICCFPPQPQFPGGEDSLRAFLRQHMKYPAEATLHEKSGTVFIQFTVTPSGHTEDYKVMSKPIGFGMEEEALRVMRLMPKWIPAITHSKGEKVLYNLPVRFSME